MFWNSTVTSNVSPQALWGGRVGSVIDHLGRESGKKESGGKGGRGEEGEGGRGEREEGEGGKRGKGGRGGGGGGGEEGKEGKRKMGKEGREKEKENRGRRRGGERKTVKGKIVSFPDSSQLETGTGVCNIG